MPLRAGGLLLGVAALAQWCLLEAAPNSRSLPAASGRRAPPTSGALVQLALKKSDRKLLVLGDTKAIRDVLKAEGGKWRRSQMAWEFPGSRYDEILGVLQQCVHVELERAPREVAEQRALPAGWRRVS